MMSDTIVGQQVKQHISHTLKTRQKAAIIIDCCCRIEMTCIGIVGQESDLKLHKAQRKMQNLQISKYAPPENIFPMQKPILIANNLW